MPCSLLYLIFSQLYSRMGYLCAGLRCQRAQEKTQEREDQEVGWMLECLKNRPHETLMDVLHDFTRNY